MKIILKNLISSISSLHVSEEKGHIDEKNVNIKLPITFQSIVGWEVVHNCCTCNSIVEFHNQYQSPSYIAGTELWLQKIDNKELVDSIGTLFGLTLHNEIDSNSKNIYYYFDHTKSKLPSWFMYYKCKTCNAKFLMCYSVTFGEERKNEEDLVHLRAIYQVEFDEEMFMESYDKCFNI